MVCLGDVPNTQAKQSDLQIIVAQKTFQNKPAFASLAWDEGIVSVSVTHIAVH